MMLLPMPWRIVAIAALVGGVGGAILGFVRGLDYAPTLPVAVVEGSVLIGIPAAVVGLLSAGVWLLANARRRRHL